MKTANMAFLVTGPSLRPSNVSTSTGVRPVIEVPLVDIAY